MVFRVDTSLSALPLVCRTQAKPHRALVELSLTTGTAFTSFCEINMPPISSSPAALIILSGLLLSTSARGEEPLRGLHFGTWGFDISGENAAIKPGDDFFEFANGGWLAGTRIPADKTGISIDVLINNRTQAQLRNIMEEAPQHAGHEPKDLKGKVGTFYRAFMDENRIEALGSTPIESTLTAIRAAITHEQLGRLMGRSEFDFEGTFFGISIDADPKNPTRYAVFLSPKED